LERNWGLKSESVSYGDKPAWATWRDFNWNDPYLCSAAVPAAPVLGLYADAPYYTVNDKGKSSCTAANVTSLSLNEPPTEGEAFASLSCDPDVSCQGLSAQDRVGSCAFTNIKAASYGHDYAHGREHECSRQPGFWQNHKDSDDGHCRPGVDRHWTD
jgi:hypothetical protein